MAMSGGTQLDTSTALIWTRLLACSSQCFKKIAIIASATVSVAVIAAWTTVYTGLSTALRTGQVGLLC